MHEETGVRVIAETKVGGVMRNSRTSAERDGNSKETD
jgi:hypothetical protein